MAKGKKNKYIEDAQKFLQKQNYDKALKEYLKAYEEDPKDVKVAQKLGDLYLKVKNQKDSVKFFKVAGSIYSRDGFHQRAIAVYRQVLEIDQNNYEVRLEIAALYRKLGLMGEAAPHFKEALKHYEEAGDRDKSTDIVKNLIEIEPHSVKHRVKLAELYLKGGKREQGYAEFKKAADELKKSSRWDDLVKLYETLVKADPTNVDNISGYGEALIQKGDFDKARECYEKALKYKPEDTEILDRLVMVSTRTQNVEKAVAYLRQKVKIVEKKGDTEEAKACCLRILKYYPGDDEAKKSLISLGGKLTDEAAPTHTAAQHHPPRKPAPPPEEEIIEALPPDEDEFVAAPPPPPPPAKKPKSAHPPPPPAPPAASSKLPETIEEGADALTSEQVPRLLTEADVYLRYGLLDKAGQYAEKILRAFPDRHEALRLNGLIYKEQGKIPEAVESLLSAIAAARSSGDDDEARKYTDEAMSLDPENPEVNRQLEELNAGFEINVGEEGEPEALDSAGVGAGEEVLTLNEADKGTPFEHDEHLELKDDEEEPFSFVDESPEVAAPPPRPAAKKEPAPPPRQQPQARPAPPPTEEESLLFEIEDDEKDDEIKLDFPPAQEEKKRAKPEMVLEEEATLEVEAEAESPVFEIEESGAEAEDVISFEPEPKKPPVKAKPPAPSAAIPKKDVTVFDEIEEDEDEEEEVEIEEIPDFSEETPLVISKPPPVKTIDAILEDEWGEEPEAPQETPQEEVSEDAIIHAVAEDEEILLDVEKLASQPTSEILEAAGEDDIHAIAEAADEAWGDALVEDEPAPAKSAPHPIVGDVAEAADEAIGRVFDESPSVQTAEAGGENMFDLSSVIAEDTPEPPPPQGSDDVGEVLSSFRERVKEQFGEDAETHFNLGIAYKEMGLFKDAIHSFETAMKNGYCAGDCFNMIGLAFMDMNEFAKAERVFVEGLTQGNLQEHEILSLQFDLGLALEKQDRLLDALKIYRDVIAINPHFRDVSQVAQKLEKQIEPKKTPEEPPAKAAGSTRSGRSKVSYI